MMEWHQAKREFEWANRAVQEPCRTLPEEVASNERYERALAHLNEVYWRMVKGR